MAADRPDRTDPGGDNSADTGADRAGGKRTDPTSQLARGELVHADVKPLDLSGIPSVTLGIALWAVAFVVLLVFRDDLEANGEQWWLWVAVAGFGLGLIGLVYCRRRWSAIQTRQADETGDDAQASDGSSSS